jgi:hypothetical protein
MTIDPMAYRDCLKGYPVPTRYTRPKGIMGGPCLHCYGSQPEHVGLTCDQVRANHSAAIREAFKNVKPMFADPKCPRCRRKARRQLLGFYVCDYCDGRSVDG